MDEILCDKSFERATVFEFGRTCGFVQFEVRWIRFHVAPLTGGGKYEAATFVERRKRKEKTVAVNQLVVIEGWDHPKCETYTRQRKEKYDLDIPKFPAFSKEWDDLLKRHLASIGSGLHLIIDGRSRPRVTPGPGHAAQPARPPTSSSSATEKYTDDMNSARCFSEGSIESLLIDRYERDPEARRACLERHGYRCKACEKTMSEIYGSRGDAYIHVHHRVPLSEIGEEYQVDPIRALVPVCPNCHAMLHRSRTVLSVEELAGIIRNQRRGAAQPE